MINVRQRELQERLAVQAARMRRYYADLREELEGSVARSRTDAETTAAKAADRRTAIDREEHLRLTELQQKNTLRTELRLLTLVVVQQPKVLVKGTLGIPERPAHAVELVWDPLLETLEAPACPVCKRPTFAFTATRLGQPLCPVCLGQGRAK
jgi:hypothetical protein